MISKKTIGINALTYPEIRNFAGHQFNTYAFKKVYDWFKFPSYFLFKIRNKINRKWQNSFFDFNLNNCDFFHFFNVINKGNQPFITTFETTLPRWNDTDSDFKEGLMLLAKNNCRQLIAISKCAYNKQAEIIKKYRPDLFESLMYKTRVLLPPQLPFLNTINEKRKVSDNIVFTIVGADFFRKGGLSILQAFDCLLQENRKVILNIVSTLSYGDYASKTDINDFQYAMTLFKKYESRIFWHRKLDNEKVKQLLLVTDVALLPSIAETFGYFILEAQAAGCPVITTDIRAMTEINNETKGWLIKIKNKNDEADLANIDKLHEKIKHELIEIIQSIIAHPEIIRQKGEIALKDIFSNHSPEIHKQTLLKIYDTI